MPLSERNRASLIACVDGVPDLQGSGIGFIGRDGRGELVASATGLAPYVVFEAQPNANPHPIVANAGKEDNVRGRLWDAGVACGGFAIGAIGELGLIVAAPESMGATGVVAAANWAGIAASEYQCIAASYKLYNAYTDDEAANKTMEATPYLQDLDYLASGVGLLSLGVGVTGAVRTGGAIAKSESAVALWRGEEISARKSLTATRALRKTLSDAQRLAVNRAIGKSGAFASATLTKVARRNLLDGLAQLFGIAGLPRDALISRIVVYLAAPPNQPRPAQAAMWPAPVPSPAPNP